MDFDSLRHLTSRQRAIRKVDPTRPVDDSLIQQALDVAVSAPSGGNRQPFRFIVIRDHVLRTKIGEIYDDIADRRYGNASARTPWSEVPVLIAVCSEARPEGPAGAMVSQPASIFPAVQNLLLALNTLGLGSVLTTLWKEREAEVKALLNVPAEAEIHAILPVGWPDRKYGRNHRRPATELTYRDRFGVPW